MKRLAGIFQLEGASGYNCVESCTRFQAFGLAQSLTFLAIVIMIVIIWRKEIQFLKTHRNVNARGYAYVLAAAKACVNEREKETRLSFLSLT